MCPLQTLRFHYMCVLMGGQLLVQFNACGLYSIREFHWEKPGKPVLQVVLMGYYDLIIISLLLTNQVTLPMQISQHNMQYSQTMIIIQVCFCSQVYLFLARWGVYVMAERSSCVKVITKCRSCSRKIKRCNSFKDNSYCDDCEETITPCKYIDVKKINILSGLARDRKNKFLFVGEGNFSFTVAFNAYHQNLWYDEEIIRTRFEEQCFWCYKYSPCLIVKILIILHQSSITDIRSY